MLVAGRTCFVQSRFGVLQCPSGLGVGVTRADDLAVLVRGGRPEDVDMRVDSDGPRVADLRFPLCARGDVLAFHVAK